MWATQNYLCLFILSEKDSSWKTGSEVYWKRWEGFSTCRLRMIFRGSLIRPRSTASYGYIRTSRRNKRQKCKLRNKVGEGRCRLLSRTSDRLRNDPTSKKYTRGLGSICSTGWRMRVGRRIVLCPKSNRKFRLSATIGRSSKGREWRLYTKIRRNYG